VVYWFMPGGTYVVEARIKTRSKGIKKDLLRGFKTFFEELAPEDQRTIMNEIICIDMTKKKNGGELENIPKQDRELEPELVLWKTIEAAKRRGKRFKQDLLKEKNRSSRARNESEATAECRRNWRKASTRPAKNHGQGPV